MTKKVKDPRPSWDEYFMEIAHVVARRSNCSRRAVGAIVARDHHILSAGYNGTPKGVKNCFEGGCPRCAGHAKSGTHLDECLCTHAEQNAICQAACYGLPIEGSTIYVTISPCLTCAKLIINAGIKEVVYGGDYAFLDAVKKMFHASGVKYRKYQGEKGRIGAEDAKGRIGAGGKRGAGGAKGRIGAGGKRGAGGAKGRIGADGFNVDS